MLLLFESQEVVGLDALDNVIGAWDSDFLYDSSNGYLVLLNERG